MIAKEYINELVYAGQHPYQTMKNETERTGKKLVGCFPVYTPEELIYAAGMIPIGMWGGQTNSKNADKYLQGFCCSVMRNNTEHLYSGDYDILSAIVLTAFCDTMKCVVANWLATCPEKKFITTIYPQNRKTEAAKSFLLEDFDRLTEELSEVSGCAITETKIQDAMKVYDDYRKCMREFCDLAAKHADVITAVYRHYILKAAWFMDKKDFTDKVKTINAYLNALPEEHDKKKVILAGLMGEPIGLMEALDDNDFAVAGDDFANGMRQFRYITKSEGSVYEKLADRIINQDGCSLLYDEKKSRGSYLLELAEKYHVAGIIAVQMKFCDPEEFDFPIYKKEIEEKKIPLLYLEVEQQTDNSQQLITRIQSFSEML